MRIQWRDWGFVVVDDDQRAVRRTFEDGVEVRVETVDIPGCTPDSHPVFAAAYDPESRTWDTDINCGMQRWHGPKSSREIAEALKGCGFEAAPIMKRARALKGKTCARFP